MTKTGCTTFCVCVVLALPLLVRAQDAPAQKFPPDKFVNLQVFPQDTKPDVLIQAMKNFTRDLGVRCPFCHVGKEGMPLAEFDFVSDTNPNKNVARTMMRMAAEINATLTRAMPEAPAKGMQVTCFTCHRGAEHPVHSPDAAPKPPGL
ncbi:MAG TPA: c-type cytochrome [Vicinamibacterales bacterium]|nr:c-type cytochrome [Vicinamibacterales bacterium]